MDDAWVKRIEIPLQDIVKYGQIVNGDVSKIDEQERTIQFKDPDTPEIHFDILVSATGAVSRSPGDLPLGVTTTKEIATYFKDIAGAIQEANSIVLVGGGASSIEYAGEIRSKYPDKIIRIISASDRLLISSVAPLSDKFQRSLMKSLDRNRIILITKERVEQPSPKDFADQKYMKNAHVVTKGEQNLELDCDLLIWTASFWVDGRIYPDEWLNEVGELDIRDTFQLKHRNDIFAFGDVSSLAETKQAITLPEKLGYIVHNIMACANAIRNDEFQQTGAVPSLDKKLRHYKVVDKATFYLPVGAHDGVSQLKSGWFGPRVKGAAETSEFKGKDLYCNVFWKLLTDSDAPPLDL